MEVRQLTAISQVKLGGECYVTTTFRSSWKNGGQC